MHSRNSLLIALLLTTVVVTCALSWAGWRLLDQQRAIDDQRASDAIDATAAGMVADIRGRLAEARERLVAALSDPAGPGATGAGVLVTIGGDGTVAVAGSRGLPFVPATPGAPLAAEVFTEGQSLEFVRNDLAGAAEVYAALARRSDPRLRAGALLRLGRVHVKAGNGAAALAVYRQLAALGSTRTESLPAGFVALFGQRTAAGLLGMNELHRDLTNQMIHGLDAGTWPLTRHQADYYRDELGAAGRPDTWALAEAVDDVWREFDAGIPPRGQRVLANGVRSVLVMWRSTDTATALLTSYLDEFLPGGPPGIAWQLADPEGRRIAGGETAGAAVVKERLLGDADSPWTLTVGAVPAAREVTRRGERTLIAMMAAVLVFLWGAMYVMARAIRREAAVARLQSEFVAAVSHEFRSPLTTIRQMSEMLEMGRVTTDDRRRAYYQVLVGEAGRLQRLVETLLNFGRMEAGAERYRLVQIDLAALIRRVVDEIGQASRGSGKRIDVNGASARVLVNADENALALAIRNLIDNAFKYSPDQPVVHVELGVAEGHAVVRVIDRGIGIPRDEQHAIFDKFVRGRSAVDANVAGTGLGLAMVRQISEAHGGGVRLESEVGRGSTFTLALPLIDSQLPRSSNGLPTSDSELPAPNAGEVVVRS